MAVLATATLVMLVPASTTHPLLLRHLHLHLLLITRQLPTIRRSRTRTTTNTGYTTTTTGPTSMPARLPTAPAVSPDHIPCFFLMDVLNMSSTTQTTTPDMWRR